MSRYGTPGASYRLQLQAGFGFEEARRVVPYLQSLGVTHLYLSPIFAAVPGSEHGYDVVDHGTVSPELGGIAALQALGDELRDRGMGLILDMVPNHVGVAGGANAWWQSVLRHGRNSPYAGYFDIDWEAQPQMATGVVIFPMLGEPFGVALESGELRLELSGGDIVLRYFDATLPLRPESYVRVLGLPPLELRADLCDPASLDVLAEALRDLASGEYTRAAAALPRLRQLLTEEPGIAVYASGAIARWNGEAGNPASFDALDSLIGEQHYRLMDWRAGGAEINYRRFFDQNSLAAIRVERNDVFEATHRLLFDLVARGIVTCVRVDHIDGLYDVQAYLQRLRDGLTAAAASIEGADVPILVEKILESGEELPESWPVAGTTGYDVLAQIDRLLVDAEAAPEMTRTYEWITGQREPYERLRYDAKTQVAKTAFASEISALAYQLHDIAQRQRLQRDIPLRSFREAVEATVACFPVYRTYLAAGAPPEGAPYIERAIAEAGRREPGVSLAALAFLRGTLLLDGVDASSADYEQRAHFRRRFQQATSPVMAKGLEDTTFYRYNRLISLNEVGNEPSRFGTSADAAHQWFERMAAAWPGAMAASSTHDTKRSEDVRARIHVLSEFPGEWRRQVTGWMRMNERHKSQIDGDHAPNPNLEYYLYQTLVGSWPTNGVDNRYRERLHEHLTKAMREAKVRSMWARPDSAYEDACHRFLERILAPRGSAAFQRRLAAFVDSLLPAAAVNALSALVIKSLAVGFPDFYGGTELYDLTLTDPDNRHGVDFERRCAMLSRADSAQPPADLRSDEAKLWFTRKALEVRARCGSPLREPFYTGLAVSGKRARHLFAFARGREQSIVAVVPRLTAGLVNLNGRIAPESWEDTEVALPAGDWRNLLDGCGVERGERRASAILKHLPFAVLVRA